MMIIEIAFGIVLAVFILRYFREIISLGFLGVVIALRVCILLLIGYLIFDNYEKIGIGTIVIIFVFATFIFPYVFLQFIDKKVSPFTLKNWNLTCWEIVAFFLTISLIALGIILFLLSMFSYEYSDGYSFYGLTLVLSGLIGSIVHFKDVKNKKNLRLISKKL